ncbi:cephalosporin-C deacetylase [Kutzneria buriramensis]|uniref:Cephalosporin-C deacetylase n=1 Tax=Kutzneria buriramensis TaxID=1045776 RepID=A0A3E0H0P2_9PSEU|nr:cephalosporin-C deacetylase [Kutzneria buriramensis]
MLNIWEYCSSYQEPEDFDDFWTSTIAEARRHELVLKIEPVETYLVTVEVFDVTFPGFGGHPIRALLRLPQHCKGKLPAVVQFHGYSGGRGAAMEDLLWSSAGYAHLYMDVRGQGGDWTSGHTPVPVGSRPAYPGFLTKGIENRDDYFYRRVYTDAVRAVDTVRSLDFVDPERVAVIGNSQGAGIALAAAGLVPDLAAAHFQAPFLADIQQATRTVRAFAYEEITKYLAARRDSADRVWQTLAYFDGIAFARRAQAPAWFSAGQLDDVVPAHAVFGAYHEYRGPKQIRLWEHNGHEAGGAEDLAIALSAFAKVLGPGSPTYPGSPTDTRNS